MNIDNIIKHMEWEEYYNPNFKWDKVEFYINNTLIEEFIEEFKDKVNWKHISAYQTLSEEFIEKFKDKVDWEYISCCQILSCPFIEKI